MQPAAAAAKPPGCTSQIHPVNDDPILYVDEDDGYVPNFPLIREECYEIPTVDVDDHLVFPPAKEVSTSEDVQQSKKANGEDFEGCYKFLTPNGTKVWCPNQGCDIQPTVGATYGSWSDVLRMLQVSMKGGHHNVKGIPTDFRNFSRAIRLLIGNRDSQLLLDRCESSNASFKVNSSGANTLVQFILCYDTSIESQRYRQRLAEYKTSSRPYQSLSAVSPMLFSLRNDYDGLAVFANKGIRNKGCGKSRRLIGAGEKAVDKSLRTPRLCRTCQKYVTGRDPRNYKKKRTEAVDTIEE
ncbi:hypothetical protein E3N88_31526 [Mikania micrantha]|uniref:Uncharacterized protein n=1 Tax=Mikania micrantha TaxID=192012 RepID=A0A5N6MQI6_9ASTR|nr:hypothetical protein E3N88_31526 [Mikania micrantha]